MRPKVSVAMATYNGEKYIKEQIKSILNCLEKNDELVISDDGSSDETLNIINSFEDERIILINGPQKGIKQNFANAIENTSGEVIFLSDQDDIWEKDKVKKVLGCFENNNQITLVIHNAKIVNDKLEIIKPYSTFEWRKSKTGILKNILKNSYIGCCMAFKKDMKKNILPIPNNIYMHDQWIGIVSEIYGKNIFINDELIRYRRHENNSSEMKHASLKKMLNNRINITHELVKRKIARRKAKKC